MYLKKLEIVGFKSFLNKTVFHFEPGITAVVGPNGTGKSNVYDSICWVLGEQSAKTLRGSEMQDVIFNGTDTKEPLGMAEVTLAFDNQKRFFSVDHNEVAITRRIFRSGESEYLLNKTPVRLKDILDILAGTGVGAESYSLVGQGKIDLILSSKPEERRLVFDEASGITRYKTQKREATRKLEETEANLFRVNDIIVEVKRQIGSLERQAQKARRYKEVFEELKTKEINLALFKKQEFLKTKDETIKELANLRAGEERLLGVIREEEARVSSQQIELKALQDSIMAIKNETLTLDNEVIRNKERINFNQEKIMELEKEKIQLQAQLKEAGERLVIDEEKLNKSREEYNSIHKDIEGKSAQLKEKEIELGSLSLSIKSSLEIIAKAKKDILELAVETAKVRNDISELQGRQQLSLARKKRLEVEKAKLHEEHAVTEEGLDKAGEELEALKQGLAELNKKLSEVKFEITSESESKLKITFDIEALEKEKLTLFSHKEFIQELKTKYEGLSETMNALILLDRPPKEKLTGLVVKIREIEESGLRLSGEAKPMDLDTKKIEQRLESLEQELTSLKEARARKESRIAELNQVSHGLQDELRAQEINLANKTSAHSNILEQFNKIKEEEEIVLIELEEVAGEVKTQEEKLGVLKGSLEEFQSRHKKTEDLITAGQDNISQDSGLKEKALVASAKLKAEIESLYRRINSDEATLKILEDSHTNTRRTIENLTKGFNENESKIKALSQEIKDAEDKVSLAKKLLEEKISALRLVEAKHAEALSAPQDVFKKIESDRLEMDKIKNSLYELQMKDKDTDFSYQAIKDRCLQVYKIDLEAVNSSPAGLPAERASEEIERLKEKLDSYGTVNLVAIEEYDELKKRYDFLVQQQNDLNTAKDSLHQAILKINRTTKQMFVETFEKVCVEFKNYFRLLFGGGDARLFLIDEQDPLESGIEIICRPPGKKLQNVLLLSGGEKALSAIALLFAIFKIKPSPFCILDEIDAALDEANVERFGRLLHEFTRDSQFIVITHNKRTISNASVMYGITMEHSGVSKIVSVKFKQEKKDQEPEAAVAGPVF